MRFGETPVPIPNTMVKTEAADGTALETVWESRWLPVPFQKIPGQECQGVPYRIIQATQVLPVMRGQKGNFPFSDG